MPAKKSARPSARARTVDEYLAEVPPRERRALERLRRQIKAAAPKAREVISYGIPSYLFHGPLIHFAAQRHHLALYGATRASLAAEREALAPFHVAGRTVRFTAEKPLPAALVARLVRARVQESEVYEKAAAMRDAAPASKRRGKKAKTTARRPTPKRSRPGNV